MINKVISEMEKVLSGKNRVVSEVLCAMLAGGHVLIEDVPGVGKTTLALGIARVFDFKFKRIQFTPDVMPSDVTGFMMLDRKENDFVYKEGAAATNLLLADEINRASPKTQAALLEVMEEKRVTVDSVTRDLPKPFIVLATQNPLGYAGTQMLPESQLDRFMIRVSMGYPSLEEEIQIYQGRQRESCTELRQIFNQKEFLQMQERVKKVEVDEVVYRYVAQIVQRTRETEGIALGVSPRGGLAVIAMAKAGAFLKGRDFVSPEDVWDVLGVTVAHRIVLERKALTQGKTAMDVINGIRESIPVPKGVLCG